MRRPQRWQRGAGAAKRTTQSLHKPAGLQARQTSHWLGSGVGAEGRGIGSIYSSAMPAPAPARRPVDEAALARQQRRLAQASEPPWLHGEVARRMAERLPTIRLVPRQVLEWDAFTGASHTLLRQRYPQAELIAVERTPERVAATQGLLHQPWWTPARWRGGPTRAVLPSELPASGAQLLWSNMGLHALADPQAQLQSWQRAIAVDGFLMFSTLGPGTLTTLSQLYRDQGWPAPMAPLVDMHDLGDMLVQAGFADPVMDQETVQLTWADAAALLAELRSLGGNASLARFAGLRTPRWRQHLGRALQALQGADGRLALPFEIVYGHAFKAAPKARVSEETHVPLEDMRVMVRRPKSAS
jgi:malonyl-CoA O-methyltransferase